MASGHVNRAKRPNTWLHRPMLQNVKKALANSEPSTHGWRARRHPLRQDPWHQTSALAHGLVGAAADQGCGYRARQQDRANGLGHDGQGRAIQGTRRTCAVNEIAPDTWRDVKVGRANST